MLQEFIVDVGDSSLVMIQYRGGSKPRDTEEAELSVATLISTEYLDFDFDPVQA